MAKSPGLYGTEHTVTIQEMPAVTWLGCKGLAVSLRFPAALAILQLKRAPHPTTLSGGSRMPGFEPLEHSLVGKDLGG